MAAYDIIIGGAGTVGLALARAIAIALGPDIRIAVLDAGGPPISDPRAYALAAGARRLLDRIGIWSGVEAQAQPVAAIDITDSSLTDAIRPILLSYDTALEGGEPAMWIVPAAPLLAAAMAVVRETPGVTIVSPARPTGFTTTSSSVALDVPGHGTLSAGLLVAADGRRSALRDAAGIKTVEWVYHQLGIVTTVRHERPHGGRAVQHFLPAGPFAILPLPGNRSCITWSEAEETGRRILAGDDASFLAEVEQRFGHRLGRLELEGGRAGWPLTFNLARELTARRFALAGDAARGVHPIAGQGLNLGLRDVAALAESVVDGLRLGLDAGDATILDRYARWRRFDGLASTAAFTALNALFSNDRALVRSVRDAGLGIVDRLDGVKRAIVREAAGLTGEVPRLLRGEAL